MAELGALLGEQSIDSTAAVTASNWNTMSLGELDDHIVDEHQEPTHGKQGESYEEVVTAVDSFGGVYEHVR